MVGAWGFVKRIAHDDIASHLFILMKAIWEKHRAYGGGNGLDEGVGDKVSK